MYFVWIKKLNAGRSKFLKGSDPASDGLKLVGRNSFRRLNECVKNKGDRL